MQNQHFANDYNIGNVENMNVLERKCTFRGAFLDVLKKMELSVGCPFLFVLSSAESALTKCRIDTFPRKWNNVHCTLRSQMPRKGHVMGKNRASVHACTRKSSVSYPDHHLLPLWFLLCRFASLLFRVCLPPFVAAVAALFLQLFRLSSALHY